MSLQQQRNITWAAPTTPLPPLPRLHYCVQQRRDSEAERGTSTFSDPMLDLMGWRSEPLLLKRLALYIAEAFMELVILGIAMTLAHEDHLKPTKVFARMLLLPGIITAVKLPWALSLAFGYFRIIRADSATMMKRMGFVHTRSFWMCSQVVFTCFSCILMVWHAILMLLLMGYVPPCAKHGSSCKDGNNQAIRFLLMTSAVLCFIHWAIWRDFVQNFDGEREEPDTSKIERIREMYRLKEMRLVKYKDLVSSCDGAKVDDIKASKATSMVCAVCLDDFVADAIVSELPCGHHFHPACVHRWLCQDWRCPLRCELGQCLGSKCQASPPVAPPNSAAASPLESHLGHPV